MKSCSNRRKSFEKWARVVKRWQEKRKDMVVPREWHALCFFYCLAQTI